MKTVLLTDDNPDIVELVSLVLARSGYRLVPAPDGRQAVDICLKQNPDLVLMDLNMPVMNGIAATAELRRKGYKNPIVVLTGSESEADRKAAKEAGCNDYLLKTLEMRDVEGIIDRYLRESGGID